jgi:hypothetical protein
MASDLNCTQEQLNAMLMEVVESYRKDRGKGLIEAAFGKDWTGLRPLRMLRIDPLFYQTFLYTYHLLNLDIWWTVAAIEPS